MNNHQHQTFQTTKIHLHQLQIIYLLLWHSPENPEIIHKRIAIEKYLFPELKADSKDDNLVSLQSFHFWPDMNHENWTPQFFCFLPLKWVTTCTRQKPENCRYVELSTDARQCSERTVEYNIHVWWPLRRIILAQGSTYWHFCVICQI